MSAEADAALWRNRSFVAYWLGQVLSTLGDAFAFIAMPLLVLSATGSLFKMGLMTATSAAASMLSGVLAGALVDRFDRRRLMIFCDAGRALVWFVVPVAWRLAGPQMGLLYVATALSASLGSAFHIACVTAVPNLVERPQIVRANGALQAGFALASLVGPVSSGLVCQRFGPLAAIPINAASFLVSALSLGAVRLRRQAPAGPGEPVVAGLLAGVRFLARHPTMRALVPLLALGQLFSGGYRDLSIYYVKHVLERTEAGVGTLFGLASFGGVLGGLCAAALRHRFGFGPSWLGGSFCFGAALALGGAGGTFGAMCACGVALGFAEIVRVVNLTSIRQELTPDALAGRVTSAFWLVMNVPLPASAALTTLLTARLGAARALEIVGGAGMLLAIAGAFTPVRTAAGARPPAPQP